jgi:glucose-1-phosphate cytidylyltransferase
VQVVILCGGQGTRIREVSVDALPKPMIPVGDRPILWHIMRYYAAAGHKDFILCLGHLGWRIKEYFLNHQSMETDVTVTLGKTPQIKYHGDYPEEGWTVTLAETGISTGTAGRIDAIARYLTEETFLLTYGDGLSNVDIQSLVGFHKAEGKAMTLTGVVPPGRFGELELSGNRISQMKEKPMHSDRYINGGFMVMQKEFLSKYIAGRPVTTMLEREPFEVAAVGGDMMMYKHNSFWQCMDTARDWEYLNELWKSNKAPWRVW